RKALAYLPAGTVLRARMYLEIKPATNSFVFSADGLPPGIFLYVDPTITAEQFANTVAHELHHIGYNAACRDPEGLPPPMLAAVRWLGGFGEGLAMLAAAGGPDIHPQAVSPDSVRHRWDRDMAGAGEAMPELERFFGRILDGRLVGDDSIARAAGPFYGVQGPFYTVGWLMWSSIERVSGRARVVELECDLRRFPRSYNDAAARLNAGGAHLPLWTPAFVARFDQP
ncbi:MAG TPA: DUF5700 domain-containing putative Zn-dependent protease, partial [Gemmatimonadales bacterium]|nr:DUF5700 domain-containing putative Zn-dependent protease [Gemmatimonadales bacterium]